DGIRDPLVTGVQTCALPICTFRAEPAQRVRGVRVPFDVDDLVVPGVDELPAAHRAIRADAGERLRFLDLERDRRGFDGQHVDARAERACRGGRSPVLQEVTT